MITIVGHHPAPPPQAYGDRHHCGPRHRDRRAAVHGERPQGPLHRSSLDHAARAHRPRHARALLLARRYAVRGGEHQPAGRGLKLRLWLWLRLGLWLRL